jgi:S-adenosylmethionine decarboxylase proenzyme
LENIKNSNPNGVHYLIDFFGCDEEQINSVDFWKKVLPESLRGSSMTILNSFFYKFEPQGVTGFLLLSASHISIHTWPEYGYVSCDLFSCSSEDESKKVMDYLVKNIKNSKAEIKKICRGYKFC